MAWVDERERAREGAWERVRACGSAGQGVEARAHMIGEPKTSGGAWGHVRCWIRPILVAMDRS